MRPQAAPSGGRTSDRRPGGRLDPRGQCPSPSREQAAPGPRHAPGGNRSLGDRLSASGRHRASCVGSAPSRLPRRRHRRLRRRAFPRGDGRWAYVLSRTVSRSRRIGETCYGWRASIGRSPIQRLLSRHLLPSRASRPWTRLRTPSTSRSNGPSPCWRCGHPMRRLSRVGREQQRGRPGSRLASGDGGPMVGVAPTAEQAIAEAPESAVGWLSSAGLPCEPETRNRASDCFHRVLSTGRRHRSRRGSAPLSSLSRRVNRTGDYETAAAMCEQAIAQRKQSIDDDASVYMFLSLSSPRGRSRRRRRGRLVLALSEARLADDPLGFSTDPDRSRAVAGWRRPQR